MADSSKFSIDAAGFLRGGRGSRFARDSPGERGLRRGLVGSPGDGGDDRIFQQPGLTTMSQRREGLQHDDLLFATVQKIPLEEVRMGFVVSYRRLDPRSIKYSLCTPITHLEAFSNHVADQINDTIRKPPFIVIPGHDLKKPLLPGEVIAESDL